MLSEAKPLRGRSALVTGASSGIGLQVALGLARLGASVALGARSPERGQSALDSIREEVPDADLSLLLADLSSLAEVRQFAAECLFRQPALHILVNNVGGYFLQRRLTVDGYERTFALNHLSYFLLTRLLTERLIASAPARIVNVASAAHYSGRIRFDDLGLSRGYWFGVPAYAQSKLANVLFTRELTRRLDGTRVTANAVHPGSVRTGLATRHTPRLLRPVTAAGFVLVGISAAEGARGPLYLASAPELEQVSGEYFNQRMRSRAAPVVYDPAIARRLWEVSEQLTGLTASP